MTHSTYRPKLTDAVYDCLTSEMVIKAAQMGIPILLSRSGVTHMGLEVAQKVGVTLIARAKGRHFLVYNGVDNVTFDAMLESSQAHNRPESNTGERKNS